MNYLESLRMACQIKKIVQRTADQLWPISVMAVDNL